MTPTAENTTIPSAVDALFRPFTIGSLNVADRIAMTPMTRHATPRRTACRAVLGG